ncbi:MAG: hypothetical protein CL823_01985 [Crocinitomicaceae bacterium]|nr:hypothetical protein [Crocinitomicaceae bacterium]
MNQVLRHIVLVSTCFLFTLDIYAQTVEVEGVVLSSDMPLPGASVILESGDNSTGATTNLQGEFSIRFIEEYPITIFVQFLGYESFTTSITSRSQLPVSIILTSSQIDLDGAKVETNSKSDVEWMNSIHKGGVYRGIKSSVIRTDKDIILPGEVQARSIFHKIPGVNMWESDAAGLQIGIGVRGLSPNRSAHLSMRQNGSPMSADPLGYPESYYSPPIEAVTKIEYVSGAGALQYGSQLGGMLNFQIKSGKFNSADEFRVITSGTAYSPLDKYARANYNIFAEHGSGMENSAHYFCFDIKKGEGWRENTDFDSKTFIVSCSQNVPNDYGELVLSEEFTLMNRLEHQPGGLTDAQFNLNPRVSFRERNWFKVDWRILRMGLDYKPNYSNWSYNLSAFKLDASRQALGYLGSPNRIDFGEERDLISAEFNTGGFDLRATRLWLKEDGKSFGALVMGVQGYHGLTHMEQGLADATAHPNFYYLNEDNLEGSDYNLPNSQIAGFTQGIINITDNFSVTPGVRWEYIDTRAEGWYRVRIEDLAGNTLEDSVFNPGLIVNSRNVLLPGVGFSLKTPNDVEFYGNAVANYRAVNFSDIQIQNLGVVVDPDITDEGGANFDLGYRKNGEKISWDVSAFMLRYKNKIGLYNTTIPDPILIEKPVFLRTNVSDARTLGVEGLVRTELFKSDFSTIDLLVSVSYMKGIYIDGETTIFTGNEIENIPNCTYRSVLTWTNKRTRASLQWNFVDSQFTDATNSLSEPNAVFGEIPSYNILDLAINHNLNQNISLGIKLNNALDNMYFTRRATGYPGPGIIPSDGRNIRLSLVFNNL